jgi:F-type H+-transporting ATPase subunit b
MEGFFAAFGINWKLLLIQVVNFGVLLTALTYFLYKPVMRIIDERRAKIDEGVRAADAASQRLADAKVEADGIVGDGAREAEGLLATARSRAEEKGSEILQTAEARAAAVLKDADARAEESSRRALHESERQIAKAAMLAAEKILREKNA